MIFPLGCLLGAIFYTGLGTTLPSVGIWAQVAYFIGLRGGLFIFVGLGEQIAELIQSSFP
jgi:hypothetical protein